MKSTKKITGIVVAMLLIATIFLTGCIGENGNSDCPDCPEIDYSGINRIYDVNRDKKIDFQDVMLVCRYIYRGHYPWIYPISDLNNSIWNESKKYNIYNFYAELLYDVDIDGNVDWEDVKLIWKNMDRLDGYN